MPVSTRIKNITSIVFISLLPLLFVACGGGGSSAPDNGILKTISGIAQKGAFLKDSSVTAYQLDELAVRDGDNVDAIVTDDSGNFSITPNWDDWAEVSITGRFFDENSAANSATELTLNSVARVGSEASNVNLFTHFVAARLRQILAANGSVTSIQDALDQAQEELQNELDLLTANTEKLDASDGSGALKNDNAILLLFSGGFMANNGNAVTLLALSNDFANNGAVDDAGLDFFQGIANYAGLPSNLDKLSSNLKQSGVLDPPSSDDLEILPKWANLPITGVAQKGAYLVASSVSAYQLNEFAARDGDDVNSTVTDNSGHFSIAPSWDDWAEISITGRFFDENAAANSATELTLNSIAKVGSEASNVNLFTHFVATRLRQILATNGASTTIEEAFNQAQIELKNELDLLSSNVEKLDISDGSGALKNDNAILLLFSGGFMSNNGDATSLLALTNDFANNGKFDAADLDFYQSIVNYAGLLSNLQKLSDNLKQSGVIDPPSSDDLESLPKWANQPPLVTITPKSKTIQEGVPVDMDATLSIDPDGGALTYSWNGDGTDNCGTEELCVLNNLSVGVHQITLTAVDAGLSSANDIASITVVPVGDANNIPVAVLQPGSQTAKKGIAALFDASDSFDADGDTLSFDWNGSGTESCGNNATCSINGLDEGVYSITVVVDDNNGGTDSTFSQLTITSPNTPPIVDAGDDQSVTVDRSVDLSGTATDGDGTVTSFEWKQGTLTIGTSANITVSNLAIGEHDFTFVATDNDGATSEDIVTITVTDTANIQPVANAGGNKFITQGQSVMLFGSGTDEDGTIVSFEWFEGENLLGETADISISGLSVGTHQITLVVTDDKGGNDSDTITVTVNSLNITVDVSQSACTTRIGRFFFVTLTLQGGETGSGTTILQEYDTADCTGEILGDEFSLPTTYTISNIVTLPGNNSITTADMAVTNLAGTEIRQVFIVDGSVVLPES